MGALPRATQMIPKDGEKSHPLLARVSSIVTLGSLGITARLTLAFAGVAILAATAHLFVSETAAIIVRTIYGPQAVEHEAAAVRITAHAQPATANISTSGLRAALRRHDDAVQAHAAEGSKVTGARHAEATAELEAELAKLPPAAAQSDAGRALAAAIAEHEAAGKALVDASQLKQRLLARYSTIFARMHARLQESIDRAWKIMGRVVARQSLLRLSSDLDDMQQAFAARHGMGTGGDAMARVSQAEKSFAATLQQHEGGLRRSQGKEWFDSMLADGALLESSRRQLLDAEAREKSTSQEFGRGSAELGRQLSGFTDAAAESIALAPRIDVTRAATGDLDVPNATASSSAASRTVSSPTPGSPHRMLVAWMTVVVLAVVAWLSFATIVSIVRPVRRLLAATNRLARGERFDPVPPGGIRELDRLTTSFNNMAAQVVFVHSNLESRVAERTQQLRQFAERDPLTGLVNRRQLFVELNEAIASAQAQGRHVGVFFLDIDNFKTLNDSLGHAYGDEVLRAIASRLEATARDFGFAARLGGDEFMVVHEGAETLQSTIAAGTRLVAAFQDPLSVDGREVIVSVSAGASVYPDHEREAEALLRAADAALFKAKALGRSQLVVCTPELLAEASAKFAIEQRLRRAIQKGEFELFYQPEVSVQTLEVSLVEALLRWRTPDGQYRSPGEFLAVAEESGLIGEINEWVLRTAIEATARWHRGAWPGARVAINVSPRQFLDAGFIDKLQALLAEFKLPARCLELELTESVLQTGPTTVATLRRLRDIGVAIALDDFGTGFSSMASLEQLPLSRVKLDRSLIARMDSSARSASIARATIGLCSDLGLEVTAEGVERLEQFALLLKNPSLSLQGFLVAEPVHGDDLPAVLAQLPGHCQELVLSSRELARSAERKPDMSERIVVPGMRIN
jgi:diguanylate cyclase (GGDEF)-like protein